MKHQASPNEHTADTIAKEYSLQQSHVKDILKYFQPLDVHIPKNMQKVEKTSAIKGIAGSSGTKLLGMFQKKDKKLDEDKPISSDSPRVK